MKNADLEGEEYNGSVTIPGESETTRLSLFLDNESIKVVLLFDSAVGGAMRWIGSSVRITERLKYTEILFETVDVPKQTIRLVWKVNADLHDGTAAGVVTAQPNKLRVSGEKGFTLIKAA